MNNNPPETKGTFPLPAGDQRPSVSTDSDVISPASLTLHDMEKATTGPKKSTELQKSISNVLSRAATHLTTRSLPEPPPPPDGGLRAWSQVACAWLVIFVTWGQVNAFGAFQTYYTEALAPLSPSVVSWIGAVQVWLTFFVGAFSGRLLDAGFFRPTVIVGAVVQLLGLFLLSASTRYWQLMLTQGVLVGVGSGIVFTPSMGLLSTYFVKRRAVANGLATSGNAVGGLAYPLIVRQLLPAVGFAWTVRVVAFVNLLCLGIAVLFMRPRLPPRKSGPLIDLDAFKEPVYVGIVTGLFFVMWGTYYTVYYIGSYGTQALGLPYSTAAITIIVVNAAGLPPRIVTPFIAARYGPINTVVPITALFAMVAFTWLAVGSEPGYYGFATAYGITNGAFHCLMPTVIASITPRLDMVGTRLGMAFSTIGFAALTGPPIGGALQGAMGGRFMGASIWAAVSMVMCLGFILFARWRLAGLDWRVKI
ncbi:hypothetical protein MCOR25_011006 [Pyricularia grisea]|uniref:Major facilitator superfamily (MFS) profile domain-containing protein n=1 Tax=Pyricularia grisea TaxID=148305 RepID=A0A6P8ATE7_PYRGI|nr:uncharacterized protein PgNI_09214 [Pyricularia grisea]KAI6345857.1 hypothetical protein MCOR25_011006 [Pyricularia grisea]TLD05390.1 hypothetical protein PgNI_09214 [Pyricularia grisea]